MIDKEEVRPKTNFFRSDSIKKITRTNPSQKESDYIESSKKQYQNKTLPEDQSKTPQKNETFFSNYALKNNFFRSKVFSIGFFSVFITILSFYVILEITNLTSIVFYNLIETQFGDSEIMMIKDNKTEKLSFLPSTFLSTFTPRSLLH